MFGQMRGSRSGTPLLTLDEWLTRSDEPALRNRLARARTLRSLSERPPTTKEQAACVNCTREWGIRRCAGSHDKTLSLLSGVMLWLMFFGALGGGMMILAANAPPTRRDHPNLVLLFSGVLCWIVAMVAMMLWPRLHNRAAWKTHHAELRTNPLERRILFELVKRSVDRLYAAERDLLGPGSRLQTARSSIGRAALDCEALLRRLWPSVGDPPAADGSSKALADARDALPLLRAAVATTRETEDALRAIIDHCKAATLALGGSLEDQNVGQHPGNAGDMGPVTRAYERLQDGLKAARAADRDGDHAQVRLANARMEGFRIELDRSMPPLLSVLRGLSAEIGGLHDDLHAKKR